MKICLWVLFLFILPFLDCGIQNAHCGLMKSEISSDDAIKLFTDANEKYQLAAKFVASKNIQEAEQKLKEATLQYEAILARGFKNGQIYYNLGNTYYRQGELGKAILNYRRAEQLIPRNADVDTNLRLIKGSIEDKELSNGVPVAIRRIFFWFFLLNQNELSIVAVALYVVLMALLFFLIVCKYEWLKRIIIGFSAGLFIAVVSLGIKIYIEQGVNRGVIVTSKCEVRYGPGEEYEPKFEVHNGAECVIEDEKDGWYRVYLKVGVKQDTGLKSSTEENASKDVRRGWLQKKNVDVI
ncbi:MAG: tetratricopeptide repeat protein [Candidatus Brocadia sp.]|nr:tetratricopeptide repeat protein [Candidatus Brocadia sp.]